jgi:hypothetical protein
LPLASGTTTSDSDPEGFESWLRHNGNGLGINFEYVAEVNQLAFQWFKRIYDELGPISEERLRALFDEACDRSTRIALDILTREVQVHGLEMVEAQIEVRSGRFMAEGRDHYFLDREVNCWIIEDAVQEIGELVQDYIMEREFRTWPVCGEHGFGLHLDEVQGQVVWRCRPQDHVVRVVYSNSVRLGCSRVPLLSAAPPPTWLESLSCVITGAPRPDSHTISGGARYA